MRADFFTTTQPVPKSLLTFLLQDSECVFVNGPPKLILFINSRSTHPPHLLIYSCRQGDTTLLPWLHVAVQHLYSELSV